MEKNRRRGEWEMRRRGEGENGVTPYVTP